MQILSALDAITPAWKHTQQLLFGPRRWKLALKITAVAFFAEAGGCNGFNSTRNHAHSLPGALPSGIAVATALFAVALAMLIGLAFFYLFSRLQFVLFQVVLRSETTIAPIWKRYGPATWRWVGLKLLFFLLALLCLTPVLVPAVLYVIHLASSDGSANVGATVLGVIGFILAIVVFALVFGIGYTLLRDFGLPSMALESTPMRVTVSRIVALVRAEPSQVALYLVMRVALGIAGTIVAYMLLFIGSLIALIPLGGVALALWLVLRHAALAGHVVMISGWVFLGSIFLVLFILAAIMTFGSLYTFFQAYTLYFLGGRYPLLGDILTASAPSSTAAYAPHPGYGSFDPQPPGIA